jgi:hypothetical protein
VDVTDLRSLLKAWGGCDPLPDTCHADLNGDGVVDVNDLLAVLERWS